MDTRRSPIDNRRVEWRVHPLERPYVQLRDDPPGAQQRRPIDDMEPQRAVDDDRRRQGLHQVLADQHEQREDVPRPY